MSDKYKKGMVLFKKNLKTGDNVEVVIEEVLYKLSTAVCGSRNKTEKELDELIDNGTLLSDIEKCKNEDIRKIEELYGIKLKEV